MRRWIIFILLAGIVLAVAGAACSNEKSTGGTKPTATATVAQQQATSTQPPPATVTQPADPNEALRIVSTSLGSNKLGVTDSGLKTAANTQGDGTFVYVDQTRFFGVERFIIWLVLDGVAYPVNGATKDITPELPWPRDADPAVWERTGLSPYDAREALGIVFGTN